MSNYISYVFFISFALVQPIMAGTNSSDDRVHETFAIPKGPAIEVLKIAGGIGLLFAGAALGVKGSPFGDRFIEITAGGAIGLGGLSLACNGAGNITPSNYRGLQNFFYNSAKIPGGIACLMGVLASGKLYSMFLLDTVANPTILKGAGAIASGFTIAGVPYSLWIQNMQENTSLSLSAQKNK